MRIPTVFVLLVLAGCRGEAKPAPAAIEQGSVTALQPALDTSTVFWAEPDPGFVFDRRIGVIEYADAEWCLTIHNDSIQPGAPILILAADSADLEMWPARVTELRERPCSEPGGDRGFLDDPEGISYGIQIAHDLHDGVFIGVLAPLPRLSLRDFRFQADLNADNRHERFEVCTSFEGVQLRVTPADGAPLWQRYYYLPYDTEPTCSALRPGGVIASR
jgi:hypothetical protein